MPRTKTLICFPKLNDAKGDITKRWYVEWAFRLPDSIDERHLYRTYDGLCSGTAEERYARARAIIKEKTEWLKSGAYLTEWNASVAPAKMAENFRPEVQTFKKAAAAVRVDSLIQKYLQAMRPTWEKRTVETYVSKLKYFQEWVELELDNIAVTQMNRQNLLPFFYWIVEKRGVCRLTCEKYVQVVRMFFGWLIDEGVYQDPNPIYKIPKLGKVVDCAPVPLTGDDRQRLREAMETKAPWLWLACEIQYYCAIRPGTELRLLRVGDIDRERRLITVRSENAKEDRTESVSIPPEVMERMERMGLFNYDPKLYVFGKYGVPGARPLGKNTQRNQFNRYREQLGISRDKTWYSWKHSGAISAAEAGMPIYDLQDHLRHKSIATTEEYIRKRLPKKGQIERYAKKI